MIGRITYWNNPKGFGFITVANTDGRATFQTQYFFHHSNFRSGETPVLGGIVVFNLGEPVALGKRIQAVGIRYASPAEIEQTNYIRSFGAGVDALKAAV
jgi:cold shock CspA family protein